MHTKIIALLALSLLVISGCVTNTNTNTIPPASAQKETMTDESTHNETTEAAEQEAAMHDTPTEMDEQAMGEGLHYQPFTQAAYDTARSEGKTIFLEFYANWCPICKAQAPALESGLSKIVSENMVAFRVNYKDSETDADETAMAKKYNITYQHTHIVADSSEQIKLRSNEEWSEADVIEKVGAFA